MASPSTPVDPAEPVPEVTAGATVKALLSSLLCGCHVMEVTSFMLSHFQTLMIRANENSN
ncbi:hypothetical protein LguiA_013329 [Lonicera macranthoides]